MSATAATLKMDVCYTSATMSATAATKARCTADKLRGYLSELPNELFN